MKYIPINVVVPGSGGDELDLTPAEARKLVERLQKELEIWYGLVAKVGVKAARRFMAECHDQRRRG